MEYNVILVSFSVHTFASDRIIQTHLQKYLYSVVSRPNILRFLQIYTFFTITLSIIAYFANISVIAMSTCSVVFCLGEFSRTYNEQVGGSHLELLKIHSSFGGCEP